MSEAAPWIAVIIGTAVTSIGASSGFWAYITRRDSQKGAAVQLLLGLAHDRIIFLGKKYIEQGWLTYDEYEDLEKYLVSPYSQFGGNGLAEQVWMQVKQLPLRRGETHQNQLQHIEMPKESHD